MGNVLQRIFNRMGKIVHRINAPFIPLAVMVGMVDPVDYRIAQVEIARSRIDLRPQRHTAVGKLTVFHAFKQRQILFNRSIPVGALRRGCGIPAHLTHLIRRQLAHIGQTLFNQSHCTFVHLIKIVGSIIKAIVPSKAEPADIFFDRIYIFRILFTGIGIIHP